MPQDLSGAMLVGGHLIANVSPSVKKETFKFPSGEIVELQLPFNTTKYESSSGQTLVVYKRGTPEWDKIREVRVQVELQVKAKEREIRATLEREIRAQLDEVKLSEFAARDVLIEGKPARPLATVVVEERLADSKYEDGDEDEGDQSDPGFPCPSCDKVFENAAQLQGHGGSHVKAAKKAVAVGS